MQISDQGTLLTSEARETLNNKVSIFRDNSIEAFLFVEGNRVCIERDGTLKCVFLEEEVA